ncbi:hypothetical protein KUF71_015220, partial [Frankliniella fusca]
MVAQ